MLSLNIVKSVRFCFIAFLLSLSASCSQAQEVSSEPERIPLLDLTNSKADVTYTHQKLRNGDGQTGKIKGTLEIKSKEQDGFIASWTTKSVNVGGVLLNESSPQAGSMLMGVPLDFVMGADGGPIKLLDKEKLFQELPNSIALAKADPKIVEQITNFFKSMDDDTIANVFFKVPSYMSVCQDTNFIVGEAVNFPTEQASPFGEGVILGNISYELTELDRAKNMAKIKYRSKFDQESVKELAMQSLKKLAPDAPISQKDIDELVMDRRDSADCEVNLSTGWVTKMKYSTFISASGETNEETFDISLNWSN